jgi:hypothetical protein
MARSRICSSGCGFVVYSYESTGKRGRNETESDEQLLSYADVINLVSKHTNTGRVAQSV